MRGYLASVAAIATLVCALPAAAQVVPRSAPPEGTVIARKTGEEVRFIEVGAWRSVDIEQDLLAGDLLRTNAAGQLAILFSDRTQIRLGRNSTLLVKRIGTTSDTLLGLQAGSIWGRAERGGNGLTVETPAAAAAIRGTDWSMTVNADGKTSLIVLEGLVELSNEFGSVSVAQGEAAVAAIGQAPTKVIIVDPDDREQMLFYLTLRGSFGIMPVSPLSNPQMRAQRDRITAVPPERRAAEDWVTFAEVGLTYDGRAVAWEAVNQARMLPLSAGHRARLDLVEAMIAGSEQRYADAARLFRRAMPRLDARRRAMAAYGGYFARALADPDRIEKPPALAGGGAHAALAEAYAAGFLKDIKAAIDVLHRAEQRYPDDPTLPAARAQFAILIDDREQAKAAVGRALSLDPDDPMALEARGNYRADFESDLEGALADLQRAAEIAPGSTTIWNALGLVQSARGADREAEAALKRAVELDLEDAVSHANLAIIYLDQDRVGEAKAEIDKALELDPSFHIGLIARGRYYLQTGEMDKAMADLLAGTTANPAYAQGLLLLGGAHYESGDREPAAQAIENADRLDLNDPVTSSFQAGIAIDDYDAEKAIDSAQEVLKRSRARGGDYAPLSANREAGSLLNEAFRLQGLDAWGRFYGDVVFDPFAGAWFVDQAIGGSVNPFANSVIHGGMPLDAAINSSGISFFVQGLALDPLMLSGRSRSANLFRRPFLEGALAGGFLNEDNDWGWNGEAEIQGFTTTPFPWSIYGRIYGLDTEAQRELAGGAGDFVVGNESLSGTVFLTAKPTPSDRFVSYLNVGDSTLRFDAVPDPTLFPLGGIFADERRTKRLDTGLVWSHTFGYRNTATAGVFFSGIGDSSSRIRAVETGIGFFGPARNNVTKQRAVVGAANHTYGLQDLTLRYGGEAGWLSLREEQTDWFYLFSNTPTLVPPPVSADEVLGFGRTYVDAIYEFSPDLILEGALFGSFVSGPLDVARAEPRVGVAWAPSDGHWLRGGYLRETSFSPFTTLSPIGVLGLQTNQVPIDFGGYADTFAARWDAEWNDRIFTSIDFQHQQLHDLAIEIPASLETIDLSEGRIDRVSATANVRLGYGFGAFATLAFSDSENRDPTSPGFDGPLPFLPELAGRVGVTWVHPSNIKFTIAGTYIGDRAGNEAGTSLEDYWTADAFLAWEPLDKRFELDLAAYNILDENFDVAAGAPGDPAVPGWGRTFVGSLKVRF